MGEKWWIGAVTEKKKVMTAVTGLSNSRILNTNHHPSTGHRRMTYGLKWKA
jgi:hypothetical protein